MGRSGECGARRAVGAGLVLAALGVALGARREAVADEASLQAGFSDYAANRRDPALKKVKAYLATDPPDVEIARVLAATDDALEKRVIGFRGEYEQTMVELQTRARIAVKAQECLDLSLRWLATHPSDGGGWESKGFGKWCDGVEQASPASDGDGRTLFNVGVTGLSVLAFLEAGFLPKEKHPYGAVLDRALDFLRGAQQGDGGIGARVEGHWLYDHAVAVSALIEAYRRGRAEELLEPARLGLKLLAVAQNPDRGWRYGILPGDSDSSMTGWATLAFESAKKVNDEDASAGREPTFPYPPEVVQGIRKWFLLSTNSATGQAGYMESGSGSARPTELVDKFPAEETEALTAAGLCARLFLGEDPAKNLTMKRQIDRVVSMLPAWEQRPGGVDFYYWRYGTLALSQIRGAPWRAWRKALVDSVAAKQRRDGTSCAYRGSWDPSDVWGADGGRVYATAILSLSLAKIVPFDREKKSAPPPKGK